MKKCPHCFKEEVSFKNNRSFGAHITNCSLNPKRKEILNKMKNSSSGVSKPKKICDKCNKEVSKSNFDRHHVKCGLITKKTKIELCDDWLLESGKYKCPYCEKDFSKNGICSHIFLQHTDKGIEYKKQKFSNEEIKSKMGWARGLNKETDQRVKNAAENQSKLYKDGIIKHPFLGKKLTPEHKEKLSISQSKIIESGKGSNNFKHVKYYKQKNINGVEYSLRGNYELKLSNWLNDKNVLWIKGANFKYKLDDVNKTYIPDFYLPDYNFYLETKGYYPDNDRLKIKLVLEQNTLNLKLIFRETIEKLDEICSIEELLTK